MSDIEQDIESIIARLKSRQSELAGQYGVVTRVIETLEKSLNELESLPLPSDQASLPELDFPAKPEHDQQSIATAATRIPSETLTAAATYFNLSQSQAIVKLMRLIKRPVTMLEILDILKQANYTFKAKVPYQSLFSVMMRDKTFVKQGKLWGLKEWSENPAGNGIPDAPRRKLNFGSSATGGTNAGDASTD